MYIIDKHKDYYDYVSHVYGLDKTETFDRRGSCDLSYSGLVKRMTGEGIKKYTTSFDVIKLNRRNRFILEAGYTQYLFEIDNVQIKTVKGTTAPEYIYDGDIELKNVYSEDYHFGKKELSIFLYWIHSDSYYRDRAYRQEWEFNSLKNVIKIPDNVYNEYCIELPILKNTKIPAIISAEDIWKNISSYISSKYDDKTIDIKLTDVEKAINHGFDKRESFRPNIKPLKK